VRDRSFTLRVNYRTSHQIRLAADRLLPRSIRDVDGLEDDRKVTVSVFNGPVPEIVIAATADEEIDELVHPRPPRQGHRARRDRHLRAIAGSTAACPRGGRQGRGPGDRTDRKD
jgi:hypothetical protein